MTSHIVFDSSYVGDTWDWFESILIVMDQELWYDPTLGAYHLREFLLGMQPLCLIHRIGAHLSWSRVDFLDEHYAEAYFSQSMMNFWVMAIPRRKSDVLFHIGAWDMIGIFHLVYFT